MKWLIGKETKKETGSRSGFKGHLQLEGQEDKALLNTESHHFWPIEDHFGAPFVTPPLGTPQINVLHWIEWQRHASSCGHRIAPGSTDPQIVGSRRVSDFERYDSRHPLQDPQS